MGFFVVSLSLRFGMGLESRAGDVHSIALMIIIKCLRKSFFFVKTSLFVTLTWSGRSEINNFILLNVIFNGNQPHLHRHFI